MTRKTAVLAIACILGALGIVAGGFIAYAGGPPADAKYVGGNKCQACHATQHRTWQKEKHAKAFASLLPDEVKNPECVKCHVTGYGKPGGFTSEEATPALKNVGCEACHGPGSAHIEAAKNAPETGDWDKKNINTPTNCVQCHNPHIDRKAQAEAARAAAKK
jgi:hypothetical protein